MKNHYVQLTQRIGLLLLWASLLLSQTTFAQSIPDAQWARVGHTLDITTDGNIVTAEALYFPPTFPGSLGQGGDQLVKYSLAGDKLWSTGLLKGGFYLGGKIPGFDFESVGQITATAAAANGGVTVAGPLSLRGSAKVPVKISADGGRGSWADTDIFYSFASNDFPRDIVNTSDGGFIILHSITHTDGPSSAILRKYDAAKQFLWTQQIDYPNPNPANPNLGLTKGTRIIGTPDGGYLLVGFYNSFGANSPGVPWVAKLDGNGNVSWQKLVTPPALTNPPGPGDINSMSTITDAIVSADGAGYALVGLGTAYPNINSTVLMEIDFNGNGKPGRAKAIDIQQATNGYITTYIGGNGKKYYAVGNTSLQGRVDPQLLLVDPTTALVATKRLFPGPGESGLIDITTAGDGSLVFVTNNNQLVKLLPEATTPPPPTGGSLALLAPTYNCTTGAITFNTSGGDGSPITYTAPGIARSSPTSNTGTVEPGLRGDPKPIPITATQSGNTVSYVFDLAAYCTNPPPPITPPTGGSLALLAPTYNCATGAFTFNTSGGNGTTIEYQSPGITGWTTNPNQFVDQGSRTANDVQPFTLMARQSGVTVTYVWDLKAACGRLARLSADEPGAGLRVLVLGNPVVGSTAQVEITGVESQALQLNLIDLQGKVIHQQRIPQAESRERVSVPLGEYSGLFMLNVSTTTQRQQVKLVKP